MPFVTDLAELPRKQRDAALAGLSEAEKVAYLYAWEAWARPSQLPPPGDWRVWLLRSGRGYGKTRAGAEWVRWQVEHNGKRRIALVAATAGDVRDTVVEGESGILAISHPGFMPVWQTSRRRLTWPNGAIATTFSADKPDRLRGPQYDCAWADELACVVAGTMVATERGLRPIETVRVGERVWTSAGLRHVMDAWQSSPDAEIWELRSDAGHVLHGTHNHPVWTPAGFTPLSALSPGITLWAWDMTSSPASCGATVDGGSTAATTAIDAARCSTATSIEPPTDQSPRGTISTVRVVAVTNTGRRAPVYNLAIEGEEEYIANGLLVHNSWRYPAAWDMLLLGLRLGDNPQAVVTTTPRPTRLIRGLVAKDTTVQTVGSTYENRANLATGFFEDIVSAYEGTTLGRQEIHGEIIDDVAGALWRRSLLDDMRVGPKRMEELERIVVAIDPAVTSEPGSDETGIIVAGVDPEGEGYVLEDLSGRYAPTEWANIAVAAYERWHADRVVAEVNNGGDLVETVLRQADKNVAYRKVHASRGKFVRAEPVSLLYEKGRIHHVGLFGPLEDQMCNFTVDLDRHIMGSPDRVDALVWAFFELIVRKHAGRKVATSRYA